MFSIEMSALATLSLKKTEDEIRGDLRFLIEKGRKLGASKAIVITTDKIIVDERVRVKCRYPPCPGYGTSLMCPPYSMNSDETRKLLELLSTRFLSGLI